MNELATLVLWPAAATILGGIGLKILSNVSEVAKDVHEVTERNDRVLWGEHDDDPGLVTVVREHSDRLDDHEASINVHRQRIEDHKEALKSLENDSGGD